MKLADRYGKCIWCVRSLNSSERGVANSPTEEHLFPESMFGVVVTLDCCKVCNSQLGRAVDEKLLKDERILFAAREAGLKETELWSRFSGRGLDSLNREARYTIKDGGWRLDPLFHPQGFRIGMIDGKIFPKDLQNAKAKMRTLVIADESVQLNAAEIGKCVDDLFDAFLAKSEKEDVYCRKIKQTLRALRGPAHIKLEGSYRVWETEWAIAKIAYETAVVLLPPDLFAKVWSALDQLKTFVEQREAGRSIFLCEFATTQAQRWHKAVVKVNGDCICFSVILFGKVSWTLSFRVLESGRPANIAPYEVSITNHFAKGKSKSAKVTVDENNEP